MAATLACVLGGSRPIAGYPSAADAVITVTSHAQVHRTSGDGCYVRTPQTYQLIVLAPTGERSAVLGVGHLLADGSCGFSATVPAMPDASAVVVNGGLHEVTGAVGLLTLSSDDGRWVPLTAGAL